MGLVGLVGLVGWVCESGGLTPLDICLDSIEEAASSFLRRYFVVNYSFICHRKSLDNKPEQVQTVEKPVLNSKHSANMGLLSQQMSLLSLADTSFGFVFLNVDSFGAVAWSSAA